MVATLKVVSTSGLASLPKTNCRWSSGFNHKAMLNRHPWPGRSVAGSHGKLINLWLIVSARISSIVCK